jgi:hypothetical protein
VQTLFLKFLSISRTSQSSNQETARCYIWNLISVLGTGMCLLAPKCLYYSNIYEMDVQEIVGIWIVIVINITIRQATHKHDISIAVTLGVTLFSLLGG